jgi:hypothetical protein
MSYHLNGLSGLGTTSTYKPYGRGSATFTASGLNGTAAESAKAVAKILAMVEAVPGVVSADAAWAAGGTIVANFRAREGTSVEDTAATIQRNAAGVGAQIRTGVTVRCTATRHTTADVVPVAAAPAPPAPDTNPALIDGSGGPTPPGYTPPPVETSSMPIWPFAVGASVLVLGLGAFFLLRRKPAKPVTGMGTT